MNDEPRADERAAASERRRELTDWIDRDEYPFESNYLDLEAGRVHYVDEGEGKPLVMLHGNGTWSFLYRHLIDGLSDEYRCVAPDYLGFGLSEKPRGWSYRPQDHARVVETFLDELDLTGVTLFLHDWGGPIGMDYATNHPDRVDSFVVMNTAAWPMDYRPSVRAFAAIAGSPIGRYLVRKHNVVVERLLPLGFGDRSKLTPAIHRHYREPLANADDREGTWIFPRELVGSTDWLADVWERRERIAGEPALLCWGMKGPLFGTRALGRWQALFPSARTVTYPDAGHFVQEERGVEMVPEVRRFLDPSTE